MENWYYQKDNSALGPVSTGEISALLLNGDITSHTYVYHDGLEDWVYADSVIDKIVLDSSSPPLDDFPRLPAEDPNDFRWFAHIDRTITGPYNARQIAMLMSIEKISRDTKFYNSSSKSWNKLTDSDWNNLRQITNKENIASPDIFDVKKAPTKNIILYDAIYACNFINILLASRYFGINQNLLPVIALLFFVIGSFYILPKAGKWHLNAFRVAFMYLVFIVFLTLLSAVGLRF